MDYETYSKLTTEQQKEWEFKYKEIQFPKSGALIYAFLTWTLMGSFAATILVILKEYVEYKGEVLTLFTSATKVTLLFLTVFIIEYILQLVWYFWQKKKEKDWIKGQ